MFLFLNDDRALFCLLLFRSIGRLKGTGFCELFIEKRNAESIFISSFLFSRFLFRLDEIAWKAARSPQRHVASRLFAFSILTLYTHCADKLLYLNSAKYTNVRLDPLEREGHRETLKYKESKNRY